MPGHREKRLRRTGGSVGEVDASATDGVRRSRRLNHSKALQEHMKNPGVRSKIQKLIAAGVIRVGR